MKAKKGEIFEIEVIENSGAGYLWKVESSPDYILVGEFITLLTEKHDRDTPVGSPMKKTFAFRSNTDEPFTVKMKHARPFGERDTIESKEVTYNG